MKILDPENTGQGFLPDKGLIKPIAKMRLHAHSLKDEHTHAHDALLGRLILDAHGIIEHEHDEIVGTVRLDDESPEALVDLQQLPEEDERFRRPGDLPTR